jgi:hypothetical protein
MSGSMVGNLADLQNFSNVIQDLNPTFAEAQDFANDFSDL